jgi:hypothetical protein
MDVCICRFPNEEVDGPLILGRWVNDNTAGLLYKNDPRLMIVRLEDFSQRPREVLPAILAHIGLPSTWNESARMLLEASMDLPPSKLSQAKGMRNAAAKARQLAKYDLLDHLISPGSSSNSSFEKHSKSIKSMSSSSSWLFRSRRNRELEKHDNLRRYQISQPLNPVAPKWPRKMEPEDKAIFKGDQQAMKLLEYFQYEQGYDW